MQYLPGFTVQCINQLCEARGHWLRADATAATTHEGRCPCCGDSLRNVPPPLAPRFQHAASGIDFASAAHGTTLISYLSKKIYTHP